MKLNFKENFIIFIFCLILIGMFFTNRAHNKDLQNYIGEYNFGIGKVDYIFKRGPIGINKGRNSITYSYSVNGKKFSKSYDSSFYIIPTKTEKEEYYLIIYNKDNPQNSILLGNYLITDIENFELIVKKFKKDSPNLFE